MRQFFLPKLGNNRFQHCLRKNQCNCLSTSGVPRLDRGIQCSGEIHGSRGQAAGRRSIRWVRAVTNQSAPWALVFCFCLALAACVEFDESTYITDDSGTVHHTKHYLRDHRGEKYFPKETKATGKKQFVFDPKVAAWAAYDAEGRRVMTGSGSGGMDFCEDVGKPCRTVTGNFRVYTKKGPDCKSGEYPLKTEGGARMPYCMYFYRGFTIHAAYEVPTYNSSHGCIRVLPSAAKWLNEEFIELGTQVTVLSYEDEDGNRDEVG